MRRTPTAPDGSGVSFDALAKTFDRHRGLPPDIAREVARAVLALVPRDARREGPGWLVELGAGTGEIGRHLAIGPLPYLGLDRSSGMLARFLRRLSASPAGHLTVADLDRPWPLASATSCLIFASRTVHRLALHHLMDETRRTARPGARLVLGRIRRPADSPGAVLRRRLRRLLAEEEDLQRRNAEAARARLVAELAARGSRAHPPRPAARWRSRETPAAPLVRWREKSRSPRPDLAGGPVPAERAAAVLDRLEDWARDRFGDLDAPHEVETTYELTVVDLAP